MTLKSPNQVTKLIYLIKHLKISQIEEKEFLEEKEFHDYIRKENKRILDTTWTDHPLHRDIDPKEAIQAIRKMNNNRAPGHDGIVVEFFKVNPVCWSVILAPLFDILLLNSLST